MLRADLEKAVEKTHNARVEANLRWLASGQMISGVPRVSELEDEFFNTIMAEFEAAQALRMWVEES